MHGYVHVSMGTYVKIVYVFRYTYTPVEIVYAFMYRYVKTDNHSCIEYENLQKSEEHHTKSCIHACVM